MGDWKQTIFPREAGGVDGGVFNPAMPGPPPNGQENWVEVSDPPGWRVWESALTIARLEGREGGGRGEEGGGGMGTAEIDSQEP